MVPHSNDYPAGRFTQVGTSDINAGYIGWAVMPSLAVFLTSLLNGGVGEGYQTIELWLIVLAVLVVSLAVSKSKPTAIPSARLRKVTLSATIVFGVSLKWASHISIGMMRGGDFWHLDAAYLGRVILPHPYDYYIIFVGVRMVVWSSLLCVVATAAIYFAMRNAEERRARRIAAPA